MEEVDEGFCRTNVCVGCPTCCQWCTDEGRKDKKVVLPFLTSHIKSLPSGIKIHGKFEALSQRIEHYVSEMAQLCTPDEIFICDGSEQENKTLIDMMVKKGVLIKLTKYDNCYLARSDPQDVARVESKTFICTEDKRESVPLIKEGVVGRLGNWMHPHDMEVRLKKLFTGCMKGRTMYVIPYSMGPVGSPLAEIGIQLTDSAYVAVCMRVMTRMGSHVLEALGDRDFVRSLHSVGQPLPVKPGPYSETWPCNPEDTVISHFPHHREIISYGSGYGGNALLGKKCFALRIASSIGLVEGWLAEHMLIMGLTSPEGKKKYIAAAFPSQCGKTNLAMMMPSVPGWKVECVGDDIAWMRFDDEGNLRAINPEAGFFGVAPGTSSKTNPNALAACMKDTIFTNVAETSDGGFYWEGLEEDVDISNVDVTTWKGEKNWKKDSGTNSAHPNSRFCAPSRNCPIMDPHWEDPKGVPIEAIIFGGRRPMGVPLVYESFSWQHGVFVASSMCSEATAAAEHKGRQIMRDPFAMRPFFGYNAGHYIQHWLALGKKPGAKMPKIFHVNWFRRDENNKFLWPGFGENIRVLEWIFRRADNEDIAVKSPVGYVPKEGSLNTKGLAHVDFEKLMSVPKDYWLEECQSIRSYFDEQFGEDMPVQIRGELSDLEKRIKSS